MKKENTTPSKGVPFNGKFRRDQILLGIFSGLLMWIAWPPTPYTTFLLFIGLAPMLVAVENIIQSDVIKKGKRVFGVTFLGFFVWNVLCIYWVYNSIKDIGAIAAIPISFVPYSLAPLLMSTSFWLYFKLRQVTKRHWALIALVCLWIGYEYLNQTWDLKFPWMTLGNGFAVTHQWVQWYEYTGAYGGTGWIWVTNILVFLLYVGLRENASKKLRLNQIIALVMIILFPIAFSLVRYYSFEEQPDPSDVVVAQPNIDPYVKEGDIPASAQIDIMTHLSDSLAQNNTEFFIWPETAIADYVDEDRIRSNKYYLQIQHFLNKYKNGNVLTGIESYKLYDTAKTETARFLPQARVYEDNFNGAVNIENSARVQFYHKSKLVPGVEALPFGHALAFLTPAFEHFGGATGSYAGQPEAGVFYSQSGIGADPVICYESIWGEYVAQSVQKGAQFIAIITNDGWWGNTSGKDQHLDYAKLRAIENRRWVCRSANTGISAFINERGDVAKQTNWWVRTAIKQDINLNSDLTFYTEHGDYIAKAGSVLAGLSIVWAVIGIFVVKRRVVVQ